MLYGGNYGRTTYGGRIISVVVEVVGSVFRKAFTYLFTKNIKTVLETKGQSTVLKTRNEKTVI